MTKWHVIHWWKAVSIFEKSFSVIHHINRLKKKNHMIISIDAEKAVDKIQHSFMIKTQRSRNRRELLQHDKEHPWKPTANIILNDERLNAFSLRSGTRQGQLLLPLLFNMVLEVLASSAEQEKEIKDKEIKKKKKKPISVAYGLKVYLEIPRNLQGNSKN